MDGMDSDGHHHGMHGMDSAAPPPSPSMGMDMHHNMMMHTSFFWGSKAEILFKNWPGSSSGMYVLALLLVFALSFLVEWLSHRGLMKTGSGSGSGSDSGSGWVGGLVRTVVHAVRVGLAYMVMLAVMSFNVGVFLAAVAGHALGFLIFGSTVFNKKSPPSGNWEGL